MTEEELDDARQEFGRRKSRYFSCSDGFCGADDCPRCMPCNFRGGVFIGEIKEEEQKESEE